MTVLRRGYVLVEPNADGFDDKLKEQVRRQDPGGKAGRQIGGQLNRALKRLDLDPIDVKADPKKAFAAIEATEAKLKELARSAETVEVKVKTDRALSQLVRFKKQLGDVGGEESGEEAAEKFSVGFSSRLGPLLAKAPVGPAVAIAAVAAAPVIGAAVSAGVIGGAGAGGVIGGLILVKDDPRVQTAGKALGEKLLGNLKADASPFVEPVLLAAGKIEGRFGLMNDRIAHIFSTSSGFLDPLVEGALDGVDDIVRGVESLVSRGKPVIDALGNSFSIIGHSVGDALSVISGGSDEAASALTNLAKAVGVLVESTGYVVRGLTEIYGVVSFLPGKFQILERKVGDVVGVNEEYSQSIESALSSTLKQAVGLTRVGDTAADAAAGLTSLVATEENVKAVQQTATDAQAAYNQSIASLAPAGGRATAVVEGLRKATQNLYGAQIAATDANEAYEASWDSLSESVKSNSGEFKKNANNLTIHTAAGRANRDALQDLLAKSNEMYFADIAAGVAIDSARKKHEARTGAIEKEAGKLKLNKQATADLIGTYGKIPAKKETDLVLDGVRAVVKALQDLYIYQRSLATGKSIASIEQTMRTGSDSGPAKRHGGYGEGGWTGPGSKWQKAGDVHADEFVIKKDSRRKIESFAPGLLDEMNATGQVPGYAGGGLVAPVDSSRRWPFHTDVSGTRIPSRKEVASKVLPAFGPWPSSPSAQRGDSGVWRSVVALIKSTGPLSGSFGNAYRPGDPLWHGSGRAVDWMGFNQDALASFLAARRPLELIHRTRNRDYAYTRGVNKGSFNNALMEAHRNHIHIAMDDGGFRVLQPGLNIIPNGTGRPEPIAGPAAMAAMGGNIYQITVNVPATAHPAEVGRQVVTAIKAYEQGNGSRWRQ